MSVFCPSARHSIRLLTFLAFFFYFIFNFLSPEPLGQFQPKLVQSILECSRKFNERPRPVLRGDNSESVNSRVLFSYEGQLLFSTETLLYMYIVFAPTTTSISNKPDTNLASKRGKIVTYWTNLDESFFFSTTWPNPNNLSTRHSWIKGIKSLQIKDHFILKREIL